MKLNFFKIKIDALIFTTKLLGNIILRKAILLLLDGTEVEYIKIIHLWKMNYIKIKIDVLSFIIKLPGNTVLTTIILLFPDKIFRTKNLFLQPL